MGTMRTLCDQVAWLEHGRLIEVGKPARDRRRVPRRGPRGARATTMPGRPAGGPARPGSSGRAARRGGASPTTRSAPATRSRSASTTRRRSRSSARSSGWRSETVEGVLRHGPEHPRGRTDVPDASPGRGSVELRVAAAHAACRAPTTCSVDRATITHGAHLRLPPALLRFDVELGTPRESPAGSSASAVRWQRRTSRRAAAGPAMSTAARA